MYERSIVKKNLAIAYCLRTTWLCHYLHTFFLWIIVQGSTTHQLIILFQFALVLTSCQENHQGDFARSRSLWIFFLPSARIQLHSRSFPVIGKVYIKSKNSFKLVNTRAVKIYYYYYWPWTQYPREIGEREGEGAVKKLIGQIATVMWDGQELFRETVAKSLQLSD